MASATGECTKCGRRVAMMGAPGEMPKPHCFKCSPVTVTMPKTKFNNSETKTTVAKVVKTYQDMPIRGQDGDTYYVEDMNAVCRYDASIGDDGDWQILRLDQFDGQYKGNERRKAIMEQRKRRAAQNAEDRSAG